MTYGIILLLKFGKQNDFLLGQRVRLIYDMEPPYNQDPDLATLEHGQKVENMSIYCNLYINRKQTLLKTQKFQQDTSNQNVFSLRDY